MFRIGILLMALLLSAKASPVQFLKIDSVDITNRDGAVIIHATIDNYDNGLFKDPRFRTFQSGTVKGGNPEISLSIGAPFKVKSRGRYKHKVTIRYPYRPKTVGDSLRFSIGFYADFGGSWGVHYFGIIETPEQIYACQGFGENYYWASPVTVVALRDGEVVTVRDTATSRRSESVFQHRSGGGGFLFIPHKDPFSEWYQYEMDPLLISHESFLTKVPAPDSRLRALHRTFQERGGEIFTHARHEEDSVQWHFGIVMNYTDVLRGCNSRFTLCEDSAKVLWESDSLRLHSLSHRMIPNAHLLYIRGVPSRSYLYLERLGRESPEFEFVSEIDGYGVPIHSWEQENGLVLYMEERSDSISEKGSSLRVKKYLLTEDTVISEELLSVESLQDKSIHYTALGSYGFHISVLEGITMIDSRIVSY